MGACVRMGVGVSQPVLPLLSIAGSGATEPNVCCCHTHAVLSCRVFKATYGAGGDWRVPNTGYRGTWPVLEQGRALIGALEAKLSVTAWGDMNLTTRAEQCKQYASTHGRTAGI